MTASGQSMERKLYDLSEWPKSNHKLIGSLSTVSDRQIRESPNETVNARSRIETIASTIKKASDLQQNPLEALFQNLPFCQV